MKKFISIIIITGAALMQVNAQNEVDALRYSRLILDGTSRFMATGGAFGAVGADFSALGINPAGIGIYKKSELTFTPSIYMGGVKSDYNGKSGSDTRTNFNLGNAGWVFTFNTGNDSDKPQWKNVNFGFGFNKYNNFNNRITIQGPGNGTSLLQDYANMADGNLPKDLSNYTTGLAFDTWLIDTISGNPTHYNAAFAPGRDVMQEKTIESSGAINEMVISFGGNYSDKLYLGGTFGIPYVKYHETSSYTESDTAAATNIKSFTINDDIATSGTGFNFKFGMIYRITDWVRFGLAVHTPTLFNLHDAYTRHIDSHFDNGNSYNEDAPKGTFDYDVTTPMRAIGSIAFLIKKTGFISADYEYVDYSEASLDSKNYKFYNENLAAQAKYTAAGNLRVGTEWNLYPIILRGGYALYGSPYKSGINDGKRQSFSAGIGLREDKYFLDISYVYSIMSEDYYLYSSAKSASNDFAAHTLLFTFGIKY